MMFKRKTWGFIFVVLAVMIILSGCESGSSGDSADIVYNFAGSVGEGDFINLDINISDGEYKYTNRITNDSANGTFEEWGSNFYQLDSGDYFFMLDDEVLIATNKDGVEGEQIITALKEIKSDYGSEIENTYNIITSLEGYSGTVTLDSDGVEIDFGKDGNFPAPYSYNDDFKAIEIVESASQFRHYGIFLNGEVGIFDSYWREDPTKDPWTGDGMSILVKQDDSVLLSDFEGTYNFVDVDGEIGSIKISDTGTDSMKLTLKIIIDKETSETFIDNKTINSITNSSGLFKFEVDMITDDAPTKEYNWSMMLVPGNKKIIVIGTQDQEVFGGDEPGGLFIGIEK